MDIQVSILEQARAYLAQSPTSVRAAGLLFGLLETEPRNVAALNMLADVNMKQGCFAAAKARYHKALQIELGLA